MHMLSRLFLQTVFIKSLIAVPSLDVTNEV